MICYKQPICLGFNVELSDLDLCYIYVLSLFFCISPNEKSATLKLSTLLGSFQKVVLCVCGPNETLYETHFGGVVYVDQSVLFGSGSDYIQIPLKLNLFSGHSCNKESVSQLYSILNHWK